MPTLPDLVIIDTNVPIVANCESPQPFLDEAEQLDLEENCINFILSLIDGSTRLVLDEGGLIFDEYKNKLSFSGQPGT